MISFTIKTLALVACTFSLTACGDLGPSFESAETVKPYSTYADGVITPTAPSYPEQ
jgi:hypothetical protein